jgi:hypothetical protein
MRAETESKLNMGSGKWSADAEGNKSNSDAFRLAETLLAAVKASNG